MAGTVSDESSPEITTGPELLDVLGDECSRSILAAASREPVTAKHLTKQCDVSPATVYRRINTLVDNGVLAESFRFDSDSGRQKVYRTTFEHVDVDVDDDGFDVTPHSSKGGSYHLVRLLSELPFEHLNVDVDGGELEVQIGLTGESVDQLTELWDDFDAPQHNETD